MLCIKIRALSVLDKRRFIVFFIVNIDSKEDTYKVTFLMTCTLLVRLVKRKKDRFQKIGKSARYFSGHLHRSFIVKYLNC